MSTIALILAAGEGTRMRSNRPKMLQPLGGRPLLSHLLDTAQALQPERVHVVVGSGADAVMTACEGYTVEWVQQQQRLGTGHAVLQAMPGIPDGSDVLVLLGDHPLLPPALLESMRAAPVTPQRVRKLTPAFEMHTRYARLVERYAIVQRQIIKDKVAGRR